MPASTRRRDAQRSRRAILVAAERLFAQHGYEATSLQQIAAEAGVARATPGYFFGSKAALYEEVLRRVHEQRTQALEEACAPLHEWAREADASRAALRDAIAAAVKGYGGFLKQRPAFARLIDWESLMEAKRLPAGLSTSFSDAIGAVHAVRRERRLRDFDVDTVVVALVSLCFLPVAHAATFTADGIDTLAPRFRKRYEAHVIDSVFAMLVGP